MKRIKKLFQRMFIFLRRFLYWEPDSAVFNEIFTSEQLIVWEDHQKYKESFVKEQGVIFPAEYPVLVAGSKKRLKLYEVRNDTPLDQCIEFAATMKASFTGPYLYMYIQQAFAWDKYDNDGTLLGTIKPEESKYRSISESSFDFTFKLSRNFQVKYLWPYQSLLLIDEREMFPVSVCNNKTEKVFFYISFYYDRGSINRFYSPVYEHNCCDRLNCHHDPIGSWDFELNRAKGKRRKILLALIFDED